MLIDFIHKLLKNRAPKANKELDDEIDLLSAAAY
jgi:hypothetical protein